MHTLKKTKQHISFFQPGKLSKIAHNNKTLTKDLLGGKGFNLFEMCTMNIPVPPGFIISTDICKYFYQYGTLPDTLRREVEDNIIRLQEVSNKKLSDDEYPLFLSVRSGAPISMPGMMDTLLNLGMNDKTVEVLKNKTQNPRFAYDSYRRFIQMFGNVVLQIPLQQFEQKLSDLKQQHGFTNDLDLQEEHIKILIEQYKHHIEEVTHKPLEQDVYHQLFLAIDAVLKSWMNDRAIVYRKLNGIDDSMGTAITVQSMVFGNIGDTSGTGVAFTRNPTNGSSHLYGEFLMNAQGEDVVAGIRTPYGISKLKEILPKNYDEFVRITSQLEQHYFDMQDIEFTIEEEKLYILQTRVGKRTALAEINIAFDMLQENLITEKTLLQRINPTSMGIILTNVFSNSEEEEAIKANKVVGKGLPASFGVACGKVALSVKEVERLAKQNMKSILVMKETSPEAIYGMHLSEGILTVCGGITSHAAVVGRGMNKTCVVGCANLQIDLSKKQITFHHKNSDTITMIKEGDTIAIDGHSGNIIYAKLNTEPSEVSQILLHKTQSIDSSLITQRFQKIIELSKKYASIKVRANADNKKDATVACLYGADGIGLCRTEHMFFEKQRIIHMREMILANNIDDRKIALNKLLTYQVEDFKAIFTVMDALPVTIRLLDPPLHEFLPHSREQMNELAQAMEVDVQLILNRVNELYEKNPMLGHRGCRLGIVYPEITEMQTEAIIEAAVLMHKEGIKVLPEIMVPLIGDYQELQHQAKVIRSTAEFVMKRHNVFIDYLIGTMIEVPRAAITADKIAHHADFFSFGTNDLTQMTTGFSRDDSNNFLDVYEKLGIYPQNPFKVLDEEGVGELIKIAIHKGRQAKPDIKMGVCGEHGGEPKSIAFCVQAGLHYVSCLPYNLPQAHLASAHAYLNQKKT